MLSKSNIKLINQLKLKIYREEHGLFVSEGTINTLDFLKSNIITSKLYATKEWVDKFSKELVDIEFHCVDLKEMKKISALKSPSDVLGVFEIPERPKDISADANNFSLMLDEIKDPGNLGTIIRTADWFGIDRIYCSKNTVDSFNPKVVQASMGSLSRVKIIYVDLQPFISNLSDSVPIYGAVMNGEPLSNKKTTKPGIILIGSEAHGISMELQEYITSKVTIPMLSKNKINSPDSLNASVACAVICYALTINSTN